MIDYVDQSVLVTGRLQALVPPGRSAARGAYVVCADVNEAGLTETVATLGDSGEAIVTICPILMQVLH